MHKMKLRIDCLIGGFTRIIPEPIEAVTASWRCVKPQNSAG
jgi:hypothetical protein